MRPHQRSGLGSRVAHRPPPRRRATRGAAQPCVRPLALAGGLTELAWVGAHALLYPLGTRTEPLRPDPPSGPVRSHPAARALFAADPLAARIPVLLVHGLIDNRSVFTVMRRSLRRRGFAQVCSWNYSPLLADASRAARATWASTSSGSARETGHERVHVVGHSLGGLIARYHVQRQGGDRRVDSLVTLGTPHQGSVLGARRCPPRWSASCAPAHRCCASWRSRRPAAATPITADLQRPRRDGRADQLGPLRPPRPAGAQRARARASGTCRCRSTAASPTRSPPRWPASGAARRRGRRGVAVA